MVIGKVLLIIWAIIPHLLFASGTGASRGLIVQTNHFNEKWTSLSSSKGGQVMALMDLLKRSMVGTQVYQDALFKARKQGVRLEDIVHSGKGSVTDTTLIRRFSRTHPEKMSFETHYEIIINEDLSTLDALLDLVHELTHYAYRDVFNPYLESFTLKNFIFSTVEERGGEIDAFIMECQVLRELFPSRILEESRCQDLLSEDGSLFLRSKAIKKFYQVGSVFEQFSRDIQKFRVGSLDFPHLSSGSALFISSAYNLPYPVAAFKEYMGIMYRVCKNDEKRIRFMKEKIRQMSVNSELEENQQYLSQMMSSFFARCENISY